MRSIVYIVIFLFICKSAHSQSAPNNSSQESEIYTVVEQIAEFPGGSQQMTKYIQTNLKYPEKAREMGMGGKVFLKFVINDEGRLVSPSVIKSSGFAILDSEAVRVVSTMPTWSPARMSGRAVNCYFNLPLSFSIGGPQLFINLENKNEKYINAKQALERYDSEEALKFYQQDVGDIDAWFNMGVIYYWRGKKAEAKKYFENAKENSEHSSKIYSLSEKYLKENF